MRLNRFLASAGLGSRRSVEELITQGSVRVNGQVVTNLATKVLPTDAVKVGSRLIRSEAPIYAVLHKPPGFVCTAADEFDRRTIFELFPPNWPQVHHVGRLDKESEGLIFVTNDGDLTHILTHPGHEVEKEYDVLLDRPFMPDDREKLLKGFHIEGGFAKCEKVEAIKANRLRLVLQQGIKRQIRVMLYKLGYEVERLFRIRIGPIVISGLARGAWRFLSQKEVDELRHAKPKPKVKPPIKPRNAGESKPRPRKFAPRKFTPKSWAPKTPKAPAADLAAKPESRPAPPARKPRPASGFKPRPTSGFKPRGGADDRGRPPQRSPRR
jgi:23S rRNA pseudouridine2605 synthase